MSPLISEDGLNQDLLTQNKIKIYEWYEDVIEDSERSGGGVEETPLVLVCETAYRRGEVIHIEGLACSLNNEFLGYKCQLPGRNRQFVMLQGEEPYGKEFSTVGFLNNDGDISFKYRCILIRNFRDFAKLRLSSNDTSSPGGESNINQNFDATASKRSRSRPSRSNKRQRIDSESEQDDNSDSDRTYSISGDEHAESLLDAFRKPRVARRYPPSDRQLKRSSMVNYKELAGVASRRANGTMTNRTTAAEDPIIKAARAENAKRAKENTEIEQEDKALEDLRKQIAEAQARKKSEDNARDKKRAEQREERKRLERLLAELR